MLTQKSCVPKMHNRLHLMELDTGMIGMHTKMQRLGYVFQKTEMCVQNAQSKSSLNMRIKMQKLKNSFKNAESKICV